MKKTLIIFCLVGAFVACNSNDSANKSSTGASEPAAVPAAAAEDPEVEKGLALIGKSDCLTCHKIVDPSTGPAYEAVAAKYPDNDAVIDSLSKKIIAGGSGNWGTVPMMAHPDISEADAKSMVRYILSLK